MPHDQKFQAHSATVDQDEINKIMAEPGQVQDPNPADRIIQAVRMVHNHPAETAVTNDEDTVATESSRPTRERQEPDRLMFTQAESHVRFKDEEWQQLERCHNLIAGVHPNPDEDRWYTPQMAMVIARIMTDMNSRATIQGASFAQQYIVHHGLKSSENVERQQQPKKWINCTKEIASLLLMW
jgi:hypothetical protein